jgi:diadenosine tetraphosphate (Ap4A) HIT family hydrolase
VKCIFCDLQKNGVVELADSLFFAKLDIHPVSPGHTLVIPRRHVAALGELSQQEWRALYGMRSQVRRALGSLDKSMLRVTYELMIKAAHTPNSPWFARQALAHPDFECVPQGYNEGVNEGSVAGQTVMHLHWHIIPRYEGDVEDPRGGLRYVRPAMGNYDVPRPALAE